MRSVYFLVGDKWYSVDHEGSTWIRSMLNSIARCRAEYITSFPGCLSMCYRNGNAKFVLDEEVTYIALSAKPVTCLEDVDINDIAAATAFDKSKLELWLRFLR